MGEVTPPCKARLAGRGNLWGLGIGPLFMSLLCKSFGNCQRNWNFDLKFPTSPPFCRVGICPLNKFTDRVLRLITSLTSQAFTKCRAMTIQLFTVQCAAGTEFTLRDMVFFLSWPRGVHQTAANKDLSEQCLYALQRILFLLSPPYTGL